MLDSIQTPNGLFIMPMMFLLLGKGRWLAGSRHYWVVELILPRIIFIVPVLWRAIKTWWKRCCNWDKMVCGTSCWMNPRHGGNIPIQPCLHLLYFWVKWLVRWMPLMAWQQEESGLPFAPTLSSHSQTICMKYVKGPTKNDHQYYLDRKRITGIYTGRPRWYGVRWHW